MLVECAFGIFKNVEESQKSYHRFIRKGLRASGARKFPMPSNTAVPAETRKEHAVNVVETVPP